MAEEQKSIAKNEAIHTVFFEDSWLAYNYKTDQWTRIPAFLGYKPFNIYDPDDLIGTIIETVTHYAYQGQIGGDSEQATVETGERDLNEGGRTTVTGIRPLINKAATGTSVQVQVGERDDQSEAVTYHTLSSVNSRTGKHDGRVDGRNLRTKIIVTGGFDTLMGADAEFIPSGRV